MPSHDALLRTGRRACGSAGRLALRSAAYALTAVVAVAAGVVVSNHVIRRPGRGEQGVTGAEHTNRLIDSTSPYLLQHACNPVDWYPWGEEALARAKREDRPILVSIGYSACHWCHVMERESFENEEIARVMNDNFVCIKVDREERPDLDEIYMTAVQMMTGSGGWPLNVFLTPDLEPFYGGTYFPPDDRGGRPSFKTVLVTVAKAYRERRGEVEETAGRIGNALSGWASGERAPAPPLEAELIRNAIEGLRAEFDAQWGGFGAAPKFPNPTGIALLLRYHYRTGSDEALAMATLTLDRMAQGGMYDQLGGGFARYSTDREWLVPHFEKMLYDNALLAEVYLQAYQATGNDFYRQIARETLDYVLRDMTDEAGGFHSAEDADSEGEEGRFYVWDLAEVRAVLPAGDAEQFARLYDVTEGGNFEGRSILHIADLDLEQRAALAPARERLLRARAGRVRPGKDDKVLTDWNGLMISAMARGYQVLGDERYRTAAERAAGFVLTEMRSGAGLLHSYRAGRSHIDGYLDDYAFLVQGLLDLHQATFDLEWLEHARSLVDEMIGRFWDEENGAFYFTAAGQTDLIVRPKKLHDGAVPSGNAVAALALLRLAELSGSDPHRQKAERTLLALSGPAGRAPRAFTAFLCALDRHLEGATEIVVTGEARDPQAQQLVRAARGPYLPDSVVVLVDPSPRVGAAVRKAIPLAAERPMVGDRATAYVCRGQTCLAPVTTAEELQAILQANGGRSRTGG